LSGLRLRGDASFKDTDRADYQALGFPAETSDVNLRLAAELKPVRELTLEARYGDRKTSHQAYAALPTHSEEVYAGLTWQPLAPLLIQTNYLNVHGVSDNATGRDEQRQLFQAGGSLNVATTLSLSAWYVMFDGDIVDNLLIGEVHIPDTPYETTGDQVLLQAFWQPTPVLKLTGEASWMRSTGKMTIRTAPYTDVGEYSRMEAVQRALMLGCEYEVGAGWGLSVQGGLLDYDDRVDEAGDETITQVTLSASKRW
jgi:hypothetical protein